MIGVVGLSAEDTARVLGISTMTLYRHHKKDIDIARPWAEKMVANALFDSATAPAGTPGKVEAAKFWLKTRARWSELNVIELRSKVDAGDSPMLANLRSLSTDQLRQLEEITEALCAAAEPATEPEEGPRDVECDLAEDGPADGR